MAIIKNSLGIKRKDMPQIKSTLVYDFMDWLEDKKGVRVTTKSKRVSDLKMTQNEYDPQKVETIKTAPNTVLMKAVLSSKDGHILDGHHRIIALQELDPKKKIDVIVVDLPIRELLAVAFEFPKVSTKSLMERRKITIYKADEPEGVTKADLNALEAYLDRIWGHLDIDIEFTRHFLDRINDMRNGKQITIKEIERLFIEAFKKYGKAINQSGNRHKDIGGVLTDLSSDVNTPFFLKWDNDAKEFELVASTIMRKRNFRPNNPKEKKYVVENNSRRYADFALNEALITFGGKAYPKFGQVVILAGGAGSGKGYVLKKLLGIEGNVFDVDALKTLAMNTDFIAKNAKKSTGIDIKKLDLRNPKHVSDLHGVVGSDLKLDKRHRNSALVSAASAHPDRKPNLIFDVTLKDLKKLKDISNMVTKNGYKKENIHLVWVLNDIHVAIDQNSKRSRVVPSDILLQTHRGAALTMKEIFSMGNSLKRFMDGDIHVAFNKVGVDSNVAKNKEGKGSYTNRDGGGFYIKDANYFTIKRKGESLSDMMKAIKPLVTVINNYIPAFKEKLF